MYAATRRPHPRLHPLLHHHHLLLLLLVLLSTGGTRRVELAHTLEDGDDTPFIKLLVNLRELSDLNERG